MQPVNTVSISASTTEVADAIKNSNGLLFLTDVGLAPMRQIQDTMDQLAAAPHVGRALNEAYTKNKVYKDSFGSGQGGDTVDQKSVLDLSPERIEKIKEAAPDLAAEWLPFWEHLRENVSPAIIAALSEAVGSDVQPLSSHCNYRMVDYYERPAGCRPPRCGEHRDFGSFSLIFANCPGLQVWHESASSWSAVPAAPPGSALLLFGWCTQIRSNGRIPARLHRVTDTVSAEGVVPRRTSAVLFVGPKDTETPLEPVVLEGEERRYVSGVKVGQLRGGMARKWRHREGTLSQVHGDNHDVLPS